jgi:arsenical pump membrane protein
LAAGFFVVVDALRTTGALDGAAHFVVAAVRHDRGYAEVVSMLLTAIGGNVFNNLPSAMIASQIAHHATLSPPLAARFAAGSIIGLAVGPNLTTIGSLSTMLVLIELRRRGVDVRARQFALPGAIVTVATLAAAALAFVVRS